MRHMPPLAPPHIFVSHSHQDNAFCRDYVQGLREAECDVWYDEHNLGWGALRATIEREMPQREHFVAIFSPPAVASQWVNSEIDAAIELLREGTLRTLMFVLATPCTIPLLLRRWKRVERTGGVAVSANEAVTRTLAIIAPDILAQHPEPSDEGYSPRLIATRAAAARLERVPASPAPAKPSYSLPDVPARLASLGFRGVNPDGTPAIVPPLCLVPAGPFRLGSDKRRDPDARNNELQRREVNLPDFEIARFPITVAEYACFVRATSRAAPKSGWPNPLTWDQQVRRLDHPVVNVSWYDAFDYAAWLAERTGQLWRLPTEAEWEKASRGDPRDPLGNSSERIYPWGDHFDQMCCNTSESGLRATSPVGWYGPDDPDPRTGRQRGASPCGTEELAGNVREWCATQYAGDHSKTTTRNPRYSTSDMCQRGGAWYFDAGFARATYRGRNQPGVASNYVGFRLVRVPPGA
jgi:formylglycine-generating enzyme required for sulfatase activity